MSSGRLPNLLIVGVPKAGTGSLFAYLAQHPDICRSDEKELGYFNYFNPARHPDQEPPPIDSYMQHFTQCTGQRYAMEATPSYSFQGEPVVAAIQRVLQQPRIVLSLRSPADRLWSAYTFQRSLGNISGIHSFEEYLTECERRRREGTDLLPHSAVQGLSIGFYAEYLGIWLEAFGGNLKVVFAEEMAGDPTTVVEELLRWLELDAEAVSAMDLGARNVTKHARSPRAARTVYTLKRRVDRANVLPPELRERFRRGYLRLNAGALSERPHPRTLQRAEAMYRDSTAATARMLLAHGYRGLPSWLNTNTAA